MTKFKDMVFTAFLTLVLVYSGVIAYWLWWPYVPIIVESIKVMNDNKQVKAGEDLVYQIAYETKMNISGVLNRKLMNAFKLDLEDSIVMAPIGKDIDKISITIPRAADPGKYRLWWSVAYKVNPLRTVTVSKESEEFEVLVNFEERKGKRGDKGKRGATGPAGPVGQRGETGDTGQKGGFTIFGK